MSFGTVGIARYKREEWDRLKAACADSDAMSATYDSWLAWTENLVLDLTKRGAKIVDVEVELDPFLEWCRTNKFIVDGNARKRYVNEQLLKKLFKQT